MSTRSILAALVLLVVALVMAACEGEPLITAETGNPNFQVAFLFEHEGCKVYRFQDGGHPRYFVNCGNGRARTESNHSQQAGKVRVSKPDTVETYQEELH